MDLLDDSMMVILDEIQKSVEHEREDEVTMVTSGGCPGLCSPGCGGRCSPGCGAQCSTGCGGQCSPGCGGVGAPYDR